MVTIDFWTLVGTVSLVIKLIIMQRKLYNGFKFKMLLTFCKNIYLSIYLSIYLYPSIHPSIHPSIYGQRLSWKCIFFLKLNSKCCSAVKRQTRVDLRHNLYLLFPVFLRIILTDVVKMLFVLLVGYKMALKMNSSTIWVRVHVSSRVRGVLDVCGL